MKTLKRLFFIISIFIIFSISAFAKIYSEFILNVPIGASYSILSKEMKDYGMKSWFELDAGVSIQFGCIFQVKESFGISFLGEIGYSHDNYKFKYKEDDYIDSCNFRFDSIQIGLLPKINIKGFSIGIGGGLKLPITYDYNTKYNDKYYKYYSSSASYSSIEGGDGSDGNDGNSGNDNIDDGYGWVDYVTMPGEGIIEENLHIYLIPYIKLTFDYSIFFKERWALNVGLYFGYDFLPAPRGIFTGLTYIDKSQNYGSFDFGVQLGLRFASKS